MSQNILKSKEIKNERSNTNDVFEFLGKKQSRHKQFTGILSQRNFSLNKSSSHKSHTSIFSVTQNLKPQIKELANENTNVYNQSSISNKYKFLKKNAQIPEKIQKEDLGIFQQNREFSKEKKQRFLRDSSENNFQIQSFDTKKNMGTNFAKCFSGKMELGHRRRISDVQEFQTVSTFNTNPKQTPINSMAKKMEFKILQPQIFKKSDFRKVSLGKGNFLKGPIEVEIRGLKSPNLMSGKTSLSFRGLQTTPVCLFKQKGAGLLKETGTNLGKGVKWDVGVVGPFKGLKRNNSNFNRL